MKYLLIAIVALAFYIHYYPESQTALWLDEQKQNAIDAFADATDTKARLSPKKVYRDIERQFSSFSSEEKAYIKEVTNSRKSIAEFYTMNCGSRSAATQLHYDNQQTVCKIIGRYQSLF